MHAITVSEILIYPIKSLGAIRLETATALDKGFRYDRRYLLVDDTGHFLTQRQFPEMGLLQPTLFHDQWQITAPAEKDNPLFFPLTPPANSPLLRVKIWDDFCEALAYPASVNDWFSRQLGISCTLVFLPETSMRPISQSKRTVSGSLSFADGYPYLITTTASLAALNDNLPYPVSSLRFRPNIVLSGPLEAFEEDNWTNFSIGEADFLGLGPHARCKVVDLNPDTAISDGIVLPALASFRRQDKKLNFGLSSQCTNAHALPQIKLGDKVQRIP